MIIIFRLIRGLLLLGLIFVKPAMANEQPEVTLDQVIKSGLQHYPALEADRHKSDIAGLKSKKAWQMYLPKVELTSSITSLDEAIELDPGSVELERVPIFTPEVDIPAVEIQDDRFFNAGISIEQLLYTGGKVPNQARAAREKEKALQYQTAASENELILDIAEAWDQLALIDQMAKVLKEARERLDYQQEQAQKAYEEGIIPYYDITRIRTYRRELARQKVELDGRHKLVRNQLERLSGMPSRLFADVSPKLEPKTDAVFKDRAGLAPELKALEHATEAQRYLQRSERSGYAPDIFAFYSRELYQDDLTDLEPVRAMGIGLRWEIFNRGQVLRRNQIARKEVDISLAEEEEARDGFGLKHEQAKVNLEVAREKQEVAKSMRDEAETSLDLAERRYEKGLSDVLELLEAEREYQKAELKLTEAAFEQRRAAFEKKATLGILKPENF